MPTSETRSTDPQPAGEGTTRVEVKEPDTSAAPPPAEPKKDAPQSAQPAAPAPVSGKA